MKQIAQRLNLSVSKVYELVESGQLSHHRLDGAIRVSEEQLAEYLEETKRERGTSRRSIQRCPRPRLKNFSL